MQRSLAPQDEERPARFFQVSFGDRVLGAGETPPFGAVDDRRSQNRGGADHRLSPRRRVLLSALVVKPDFGGIFRCGVHDVSDNGARLKIPGGLLLPAEFWLIATSSGLAYEAKTIWRGYPNVGVSVGEPIDLHDPTTRVGRRLRTLWMSV
ncbi:MAG TPA: hypothetical protein VHY32_08875 [Caulobacteraceae bacterium]|jgi:hypothetical protein|nr:hypothetical protein [Caulobacteraceae bacterium]